MSSLDLPWKNNRWLQSLSALQKCTVEVVGEEESDSPEKEKEPILCVSRFSTC
ncbi:hypothetical protein F2Q68_00044480 [Brassica cretica]|uniref:Uncharacterized protein n=1 Tax=Brassica cretica TaxID=69181 RepID=A0A8S9LMP4_BRACR|nr:hypothetical protein F2Q68_00044480 [Brassica cretica]